MIPWPQVEPAGEDAVREAERRALGFWLEGHPCAAAREELRARGAGTLRDARELWRGETMSVGVMVNRTLERKTKRGAWMGIAWLEDEGTRREAVVFPRAWDACADVLEDAERRGEVALLEVSASEDGDKLVVEGASPLRERAWDGPPLGDFLVVDLETTDDGTGDGSVDPATQRVVEVGVALFSGGRLVKKFARFVNPGCPIAASSRAVHGITDDMVRGEEGFAARAGKLGELLRRYEVVTYNGRRFDLPVLEREFARVGMLLGLDPARTVDVADLTRRRYRGERERPLSRKLGDQCAFFRVPLSKAHRAADDAAATGLLLLELVRRGHASDRLSALRAGR